MIQYFVVISLNQSLDIPILVSSRLRQDHVMPLYGWTPSISSSAGDRVQLCTDKI